MKRSLPVVGVRELEAIYAELPTIECRGLCGECCGPIGMSDLERQRLRHATGADPACGSPDAGLRCSLLTPDNRCSAYTVRPLICRLWGIEESMPCPHGCRPSRALTAAESHQLIGRVAKLSGGKPPFWTATAIAKAVKQHQKARK